MWTLELVDPEQHDRMCILSPPKTSVDQLQPCNGRCTTVQSGHQMKVDMNNRDGAHSLCFLSTTLDLDRW